MSLPSASTTTTTTPPLNTQGGIGSQKASDLYRYAHEQLDPIIQPMIASMMLNKPANPIQYMITYLHNLQTSTPISASNNTTNQPTASTAGATATSKALKNPSTSMLYDNGADTPMDKHNKENIQHMSNHSPMIDNDENNTSLPILSIEGQENHTASTSSTQPNTLQAQRRRRAGVSAEPMTSIENDGTTALQPRVIPKNDSEKQSIYDAIKNNILFNTLDRDQLEIVVDAMENKVYHENDIIIQQGVEGNEFYVLYEGKCDCFVNEKLAKKYNVGESFGELALMYNCVRQATVKASTPVVKVWAMDRHTFRYLLQSTTAAKRMKYENFLTHVSIFQPLDRYERSKIADALTEQHYNAGEYIIKEGDTSDPRFYLIERGTAKAVKRLSDSDPSDDEPVTVMEYNDAGAYFGELSLLSDQPRAASVIAGVDGCDVVTLDRDSFTRLLGDIKEILKRNTEQYAQIEQQIRQTQRNTLNNATDALKSIQSQLKPQAL